MLLREGISKGVEPSVQLLEISANEKRQPSDLVPYLPEFAKFFAILPKKESDLILKPAFIPLSDIECLTRTTIDFPETVQNINKRRGNVVK